LFVKAWRGRTTRAAVAACLCLAGSGCAGKLEGEERFGLRDQVQNVPVPGGAGAAGAGLQTTDAGGEPSVAPPQADAGLADPVDAGPPPIPVPPCVASIFEGRCAGSGCHDPGAPQVDLVSSGVVERLLERTASPQLYCAGRIYVTTDGSPSLLLEKLSDAPPCGSRMPLTGNLGNQHVRCLEDWVRSLQRIDADGGAE